MRLVFASNNAHKLEEVRAIMPAGVDVLSLRDIGFEQEIEETGVTLEENSMIKARTVADFINGGMSASLNGVDGVFADDTGLEIDALNGEPGVYTARWYLTDEGAQEAKTEMENFARNRAKALRELKDKDNRGCQFRTVITLILLNGDAALNGENGGMIQVEGVVRGRMATEEYGEGGFGYDPIFIPEGYDKTFGELPAELKNTISHRARALAELVKVLHD
ncbi:MAG: RdgB/HAM1 family non-canonical purine NTP pyrophosphatase [Paludibacteraceae bacterium]|nr:RdgB/HAM1 family non-canonical purine NTP pyrophosphatase [Paludibacteraceae bacterium]